MTIDELALENRPRQFGLLERAADVLSQSPSVTHMSVRGSLAAGTADQMSDIDFVVGVHDAMFRQFVQVLDALMVAELGAILPGWRDTIVGKLGGLGYVYLVAAEEKLYQLDLYVAPASRVADVQRRVNARLLYAAPPDGEIAAMPEAPGEFIDSQMARQPSCSDLLVEILVVAQMIRKRIMRGQHFIVYDETHLLLNAAKNLVKEALAPASTYWGWYHLEEDVGVAPIGRACLEDLAVLTASPPMRSQDALRDAMERIFDIVQRAAPETIESFGPAIDAYRRYLELA
ncbi:MAG: nucleotidyltransferase domain-containing protein [Egibacteraceae bacterium]